MQTEVRFFASYKQTAEQNYPLAMRNRNGAVAHLITPDKWDRELRFALIKF